MSPILKRDIHEQLRQAKRFAQAVSGASDHDPDYEFEYGHGDSILSSPPAAYPRKKSFETYTTGNNPRQGIGVEDMIGDPNAGAWRNEAIIDESSRPGLANGTANQAGLTNKSLTLNKGKDKERTSDDVKIPEIYVEGEEMDEVDGLDQPLMGRSLSHDSRSGQNTTQAMFKPVPRTPLSGSYPPVPVQVEEASSHQVTPLQDLRNLLLESTPSLLFLIVGAIFTGELLEHLARWRVFQRVDELFILVPMLGNLKGNLEMCLSARLGTSANIGELDHRATRKALLLANMTLLGLQALLISSLAAVISFTLGLITIHRLGDTESVPGIGSSPVDAGLAVGEQEWHEGYTRPGWKQLIMVLATGMGAAGLSSAILGSFMSSLIVLSRWMGVDPDNITPPVASCLGDLLTLFILALIGTGLVGAMNTPIPLMAVIAMSIAVAWFTKRVMKQEWIRAVARGGWIPLIGAMCISGGTGMVLDSGVAKYRGFALLAVSMTSLTGSIGAIHANRLSTSLHTSLHPSSTRAEPRLYPSGLSPLYRAITLFSIAFPCQGIFLGFVYLAGWIDISLGWAGWLSFIFTTAISLLLSHYLTLFFWSKNLDPDSYTLPIHSALVDLIGQLLLMLAYEVCLLQGLNVKAEIVA